jgi:hypothetical protein
MNKEEFNYFVKLMLEDEGLEDFLERFDLDALEVVTRLYDLGLIDEEELRELAGHGRP